MRIRILSACLLAVALTFAWLGCSKDPASDPAATAPTLDKAAQPGTVSADFKVPARCTVRTETGCSNNPGPYISIDGDLLLGGVNAQLVFSNNFKGTHTRAEDVFVDVVLRPAGEEIRFNKQPPLGGAGGNPWIYLAFLDGAGGYCSQPQLLGRCVQGLFNTALDLPIPEHAQATVVSGGCSNNPGPWITLDGELALGGLSARLIFTNNARFTHVHAEDVVVDLVIIPAGESISFHKQPPLGGVGGNPHIFLRFTDGDGDALTDLMYLGRCVQLGG